jgi:hypothetical protein
MQSGTNLPNPNNGQKNNSTIILQINNFPNQKQLSQPQKPI